MARFVFTICSALLLYINLLFFGNVIISVFLFFCVLFGSSCIVYGFFKRLFSKGWSSILRFYISVIYVFLGLGIFSGIALAVYKINIFYIIFSWFVFIAVHSALVIQDSEKIEFKPLVLGIKENAILFFKKINILLIFVAVLTAEIGFFIINRFSTYSVILSPWDVLPSFYAYLFLALTLFILLCIFFLKQTSFKVFVILLFLVVHSLLLHFYIPGIYRVPFSIDTWRHVATEGKLLKEETIPPTLFGENFSSVNLGPLSVPTVLFVGNKTSYAHKWATNIIAHKITGADLLDIEVWLWFIVWSLFVPVLLYVLLGYVFEDQRWRLLGALLFSMFFPAALNGAIGLPLGASFIFFLFTLIFIFEYLKSGSRKVFYFLLFLLFLNYFGYVIYFIVLSFLILFVFLRKKVLHGGFKIRSAKFFLLWFSAFEIATLAFLELWKSPQSDLAEKALSSPFSYIFDFVNKFIVTNLFGIGRSIDNKFGLHDGSYFLHQSVLSLNGAWWLKGAVIIKIMLGVFIVITIIGAALLAFRKKIPDGVDINLLRITTYFGLLMFANVFVSWYFFKGVHLLAERMDLMISLMILFVLVYVVAVIDTLFKEKLKKFWHIALCLILSVFIVMSYTSGPRYQRATDFHIKAMRYIYNDMVKTETRDFCVLADFFPVNVLQTISAEDIINGNFPIQYNQFDERGNVFLKTISTGKMGDLKQLMIEENFQGCYFVLEKQFMSNWSLPAFRHRLGEPVAFDDEVYTWKFLLEDI